jgi:nucleoside-diphosphate-sugar epimerase
VRVLVTGATGFVGGAVCGQLHDAGHTVVAALRTSRAVAVSAHEVVVVGSIDGNTQWRQALNDIDGVVHLAARTHQGETAGAAAAYLRLNADASAQLARCAVVAGVTSFVYMSSIKVNGESSPLDNRGALRPLHGDDEPRPTTAYGRSKWEAEKVLQEIAGPASMRLTMLRPPLVYGPGQKSNLDLLMRAVDNGIPMPFAGLDNRRSLIGVDNLASAVAVSLMTGPVTPAIYTLADTDISSAKLVRAMAHALGRPARLFYFPPRLLQSLAKLTGRLTQLEKITGSLIVDTGKFRAATGWVPKKSLEESLEATVARYRAGDKQ